MATTVLGDDGVAMLLAAATMRTVMASPASPFAISEASSIGIPKAAAAVPVGWRGNAWGNAGEILPVL